MQEIKGQRKRLNIKGCTFLGIVLAMIIGSIFYCAIACSSRVKAEKINAVTPSVSTTVTGIEDPIIPVEEIEAPICGVDDPNNDIYPYSLMSKDWGVEVYEQGFRYYEIPSSYKMAGGMFPEVAQVYLWGICKEAGVDYSMMLALIERESGYRYNATGDSGRSKGLVQIQERWHTERMEALGVTDLYNPYSNMRVGVDFLAEIQDRYLDNSGEHCVLMVYNMGATGANRLWAEGIYSTDYSRQILRRAQEIKQELQER